MNYNEVFERLNKHRSYIQLDHNRGARSDDLLNALDLAIDLVEKKINLCDTCTKCFADCDNGEEGKDFFFGNGVGNDNVYKCNAHQDNSH